MKENFIFLINSLSSGGAEKILTTIANKLVKEGHNVEIIFLEKREFYKLDKNIKKVYLSKLTGDESGLIKLIYLPLLALKLKTYIKENKINFIQSHLYRANYINILAKIFGSTHKAQIVIHGLPSFYKKQGVKGIINIFLIKNIFKKADSIVYVSKRMKLDAMNLFKFNKEQIVINNPHNIAEIEKFSNEQVDNFVFKKNKIYIISVGRLVKLKRNKDLIKTLSLLPEKYEVLFLGDGNERKDLELLAKKMNVHNRTHFLGQVNNPYKYIKNSSLLVHTSETEGFPNVLVEALACGIPVVSSDCISGPREILHPNSNIMRQLNEKDDFELGNFGVLYPVGNINALKKAIIHLINNKEIYKSYKSKAKERANDFSLEKIVEKYKKILSNKNQ